MFATCRALFVIALGLGFAGAPVARADDKKPEKPGPGNPTVIQIDVSKLPPDVLKEVLKYAKPEPAKPGAKPDQTKPVTKPEPTKPGAKPEQTKPGTKPTSEQGKPGAKPSGEQGKPVVIEIHVGQLPPEALKQLLLLAEKTKPAAEQGKPGAKPTGEPNKPGKPGVK